jgi:integrase
MMIITIAYTGMRWSEALGLRPDCVRGDTIDIAWKLYELNARFYQGRPKDGSIRTADAPPFLAELLAFHLEATQIAGAPAGIPSLPGAQGTNTCSSARAARTSVVATTQRG